MDPGKAREIFTEYVPYFRRITDRLFYTLDTDERANIASEAVFLFWRQMANWKISELSAEDFERKLSKNIRYRVIDAFFRIRGGIRVITTKQGRSELDFRKTLTKAKRIDDLKTGRKNREGEEERMDFPAPKTDFDVAASSLIKDAIEVLPLEERLVFALSVVGYNLEEIGQMMSFSKSRAFQVLQRAKEILERRKIIPPPRKTPSTLPKKHPQRRRRRR